MSIHRPLDCENSHDGRVGENTLMPPTRTTTQLWLTLFFPLFACLAAFFLYQTSSSSPATQSVQTLKPEYNTLSATRGKIRTKSTIVGNCFIYHAFWVPTPTSDHNSAPRFAHSHITLHHGTNDRCHNFQNATDCNQYKADDGSYIMPRRYQSSSANHSMA